MRALAILAAATGVAQASLDMMMFYECYPTEQYQWANWCQSTSLDTVLTGASLGMKGFYRLTSGIWCKDQHDLCPGWESAWAAILKEILPHLPKFPGDAKAPIQGIFLGDEQACHASIPLETFEIAANRIRADVDAATHGRYLQLYENECSDTMQNWTHVPTALDLFSIDHYDSGDPVASVNQTISIYTQLILPKMSAGQRVLFVPGTFADSTKELAPQDAAVKAMLEGFVAYAQANDDVVRGFNPWHFAPRNDTPVGDKWYALGMEQLPDAYAYMQEVGKQISGGGDLTDLS